MSKSLTVIVNNLMRLGFFVGSIQIGAGGRDQKKGGEVGN